MLIWAKMLYNFPDLSSVGAEVEAQQSSSASRSRDSSRGGSRDSSRDRLSNSSTLERKSSQPPNPLRPLPENLTFDMRYNILCIVLKSVCLY